MITSLDISAALLSVVLLLSAGSVPARTGGAFVPIVAGSPAQSKVATPAVSPSQLLAVWTSPIYTGGGDGHKDKDKDKDIAKDKDKDKGGDKSHQGSSPTPEPSTILSFGAALLIGAGVFYSRRLRGSRK